MRRRKETVSDIFKVWMAILLMAGMIFCLAQIGILINKMFGSTWCMAYSIFIFSGIFSLFLVVSTN